MPLSASADPGTIILDSMAFKLQRGTSAAGDNTGGELITVSQLSAYEPGVTIGAVDVNSHPVLSTWAISDLTGGHGLSDHQAGVTDQRYRFATADVSRPGKWFANLKVSQETGTSAAFWPCGDLLYSGNVEMYGAFGTDLHIWDESTDSWTDTTQNLTATPVNTGVAFKGTGTLKLFIPMGASGYATYTGAVFANVAASGTVPAAKAFCVYGGSNLICLDTAGQLWYSTDGAAWTSYGTDGKIDGSLTANWLYVSRDAMGNPTVFVVTTGGVFSFDPAGPTLYELDLKFPNHPSQGLTGCSWRGEDFIAVGVGVHNYVAGNIGAMGLDRDEGLPFYLGYNSKIVSMIGSYNDMYALVQGDGTHSTSSLHRWTGFGWHWLWESEVYASTVTRLYISGARSQYRLWLGEGNRSWTIDLPIAFTNPRQLYDFSASSFETYAGYVQTGLTNVGLPGSKKIAHSVGIRVGTPDGTITLDPGPTVKYRLTDDAAFTSLVGPKGTDGTTIVPDGTTQDTYYYWFDSNFTGVLFDEIELQIEWNVPWIIKWVALYYGKHISGNLAWTATLDLSARFEGNNPEVMAAKLDTLTTSGQVYTMIYRDTAYKVRVASWSGEDSTGRGDNRSTRSVQMIEVHDRP